MILMYSEVEDGDREREYELELSELLLGLSMPLISAMVSASKGLNITSA